MIADEVSSSRTPVSAGSRDNVTSAAHLTAPAHPRATLFEQVSDDCMCTLVSWHPDWNALPSAPFHSYFDAIMYIVLVVAYFLHLKETCCLLLTKSNHPRPKLHRNLEWLDWTKITIKFIAWSVLQAIKTQFRVEVVVRLSVFVGEMLLFAQYSCCYIMTVSFIYEKFHWIVTVRCATV